MKAVGPYPCNRGGGASRRLSVPVAGALLVWLGRTGDIGRALRTPRTLLMGMLTAALITINWCIYVWAIAAGRTLETALGYYINPLFSVFLGAVLLGERLSRAQKLAIALTVVAVAIMTWETGGLPWVSIALAVSWAFYALFKKTLPIGPAQGFFLEVLLLAVPALGYIVWVEATGSGHFGDYGMADVWLLAAAGLATAVPLISMPTAPSCCGCRPSASCSTSPPRSSSS